jgi:hypothetical protein
MPFKSLHKNTQLYLAKDASVIDDKACIDNKFALEVFLLNQLPSLPFTGFYELTIH